MKTGGVEKLNRREAMRTLLPLPRSATLDIGSLSLDAEMIDLSETGAKFRFAHPLNRSLLHVDAQTVCSIRLESGAVACIKASVRWTQQYPEGIMLGVRFNGRHDAAFSCLVDGAKDHSAS